MNKRVIITAFLTVVILLVGLIVYLDHKEREVKPAFIDNRDCLRPEQVRANPVIRDRNCLFKNRKPGMARRGEQKIK